ncbi:O-antigen ligase family protein [Halomonas sp.]|uniref:O-antigen ligase family protein n=1 Tax=Halomonas sp. TaxID=1486246 RepID=UPI003D14B7BB
MQQARDGEGRARGYTGMAVCLLGALSLVAPSGYSVGALLLVLAAPLVWLKRRRLELSRQDLAVIGVMLAYAAVGVIWAFGLDSGWRDADKPLRFALAVLALLVVIAYPPRLAWLWAGLALGAIGAGGWATWQRFAEGVVRATGHTHPIQFGNISMLLGVMCLAGLGWAFCRRHRLPWVSLLALGALLGVLGSLFSGSRGGWIGVPFMLLVLYRAYGGELPSRWRLGLLAVVGVAGLAVLAIPQFGVQARVWQAFHDIALYISGDNLSTSVGLRFEMWQGAARLIAERPLLGYGELGYHPAMQALADAGAIHPDAARFGHAHNELLDAFAKRGVLGAAALLALYLVPLRLFAAQLQTPDPSRRALATAGALLGVAYIDFGLTQAFLEHNSGVMMFAFLLAVLWGSLSARRRHPSPPDDLELPNDRREAHV